MMNRKAQAIVETALFVGIMLMVLLAALNYRRNLYEQRLVDVKVFQDTKDKAYNNSFTYYDIDDTAYKGSGAIVSYSLNVDRQLNRPFQGGQRSTAASSASVYWSNSEDPPDLNYNYFNQTDVPPPDKKIYYPRPGTENPEDGFKLSTADYIAIAYPIVASMAQHLFNLEQYPWWRSWGGYLNFFIRLGCFIYLTVRYYQALQKIDESDAERQALKDQDEQMGEWGWRVADWVHDRKELCPGASGDKASKEACERVLGKNYVKKVTAQIWDTQIDETKGLDYQETQRNNRGSHVTTRSAGVTHDVVHTLRRRYDVTAPDPTGPLAGHTFEDIGEAGATVNLGGGASETWTAP